jgi:hypothetical protein
MRFNRFRNLVLASAMAFSVGFIANSNQMIAYCQETTGGLQGTVKDPSGAVVPKAKVVITGSSMIGAKELLSDASGYYRVSNLPPGIYTISVKAEGFKSFKREGLTIQVGHLPTVDVTLPLGEASTTVEVTEAAPVIDTSTTENLTNVGAQALQNLPTGTSFQSVIQFAPMARNEPLAGYSVHGSGSGGTGGGMPGSSGNGNSFGYSIGGGADSENSYLVEGQDTENISGGTSKANVPMEFIQEVQMKTSGISAEFGGALGGVVNVIMKKGSNEFHGSLFSSFENSGMDANQVNPYLRYNPSDSGNSAKRLDPTVQIYSAKKDDTNMAQPGFTLGGPIKKDKVWFAVGFEPQVNSVSRTVNFNASGNNQGKQNFTQDRSTYYATARIDAELTKNIRVFGSWLYQYAREMGDTLPTGDPVASESTFLNPDISTPVSSFAYGLGWAAPNATYNFGGDITLSQHLVSTTRFGYFFENYHDFGWQTTNTNYQWYANGVGALDNAGNALPASLQKTTGTSTAAFSDTYTRFNANKHWQLNQDFAFYKSGWAGTHNFKFGYQLNHLENSISQGNNVPWVRLYPGQKKYSAQTSFGSNNCTLLSAEWSTGNCAGQYGYVRIEDIATITSAPVGDWNHAFYVQDSWTLGHGLTIDAGLRMEKESLPPPAGIKVSAINFNWSDKIEPRVGAAWDPTGKGKMKLFGSFGVVNDVMKLLVAQTSWGAQAYESCFYPLGPDGTASGFSTSDINVAFKSGRACPSASSSTGAYFGGNGSTPQTLTDAGTGVSILENVNARPWEPAAPGLKPYRQHEYVLGWDYQLPHNVAFEVRYDRRRLDHVIEDASLSDINWGETFAIVNPGEGVNASINKFASYLGGLGEAFGVEGYTFDTTGDSLTFGSCPNCPANPKAVRNYDGLEFRLTMPPTSGWTGMFSYTYSRLWGNYAGLTNTDQSDGGSTGRNSPDTSRAFDEPYYYFGANGKSNNGFLPTDRPNVFKASVYKTISWKHQQTTSVGLFQTFYQGSPVGSYIDVGAAQAGTADEGVYVYGRDRWVNMSADANGNITLGNPYLRRTPWFSQSDLSASHEVTLPKGRSIKVEATALNTLNQHAVVAYGESMDSWNTSASLNPGGLDITHGAASYAAYESAYDVKTLINTDGITMNSQYGKPYLFQMARSIRLAVHFTF